MQAPEHLTDEVVQGNKDSRKNDAGRLRRGKMLTWALFMVSIALTFVIVVPLHNNTNARAEVLQNQVLQLSHQTGEIGQVDQGLWNDYTLLQQEFLAPTGDFSPGTNLVELRASYDRLKADHNQLLRDLAQLQARYALLSDQFRTHQNNAIAPPYVTIQERNIDIAFSKLDGTQVNWSIPLDRYELDVERGIKARSGVFGMGMPVLRFTDNPGQEIWVTDFRDFMDPIPFVAVMTDIYLQAPDDRTFITETWHIVGQIIQYVFEEDEIPRYPLETLVGRGGDCEDTAVLFASMIKAAPVDWTLELVYINSLSPTDPQGFSDHVIVFIDTGSEHYYIETTRNDVMEPFTEGVVGWFVPLE
jgi:hypothetical protein